MKKQEQITRLCNLVPDINPRINSLHTTYSLKRDVDKVFNEKLKDETARLKYGILEFIQGKIYDKSPDDLKKFRGIYFIDKEGKNHEILPYMLETSFHVKMDVDGQMFIQAGNGFTLGNIKMEDVIRREIANTTEEAEVLIGRINSYFDGVIEINLIKWESDKEFRIGWNLAGLIHEKAANAESGIPEMTVSDSFDKYGPEPPMAHA